MNTAEEIEAARSRLSRKELEAVRLWLDDHLEEQLELRPEFKEKVLEA